MSGARECLLTLVLPASIDESVGDLLLEHPQWAPRFVCFRADGHGQAMPLSGSAELVRGRSPRLVVQVILPRPEAQALLARLRSAIPNPEVAYWIADLAEAGRLA